jgi:hypothetical protein
MTLIDRYANRPGVFGNNDVIPVRPAPASPRGHVEPFARTHGDVGQAVGRSDEQQEKDNPHATKHTPPCLGAKSQSAGSSSPRAEHRRGGHHGAIRPAPDVQYTQALPGDSYLPRQDASLRRSGRKDAHNG